MKSLELTVYARVDTTIGFANSTVTITDDVVPANELTTSNPSPTYTWTSSLETAATIDADTGVITLTGGTATTTIEVTSAQSDTHKSATASYMLTVTAFPPNLPDATTPADRCRQHPPSSTHITRKRRRRRQHHRVRLHRHRQQRRPSGHPSRPQHRSRR